MTLPDHQSASGAPMIGASGSPEAQVNEPLPGLLLPGLGLGQDLFSGLAGKAQGTIGHHKGLEMRNPDFQVARLGRGENVGLAGNDHGEAQDLPACSFRLLISAEGGYHKAWGVQQLCGQVDACDRKGNGGVIEVDNIKNHFLCPMLSFWRCCFRQIEVLYT